MFRAAEVATAKDEIKEEMCYEQSAEMKIRDPRSSSSVRSVVVVVDDLVWLCYDRCLSTRSGGCGRHFYRTRWRRSWYSQTGPQPMLSRLSTLRLTLVMEKMLSRIRADACGTERETRTVLTLSKLSAYHRSSL